ncbi:MAG TPA: AAA family ATPase [Pirellulales bacterium]|jgi:type II secretory pathway predicted ATPase ExeA
MYEAFFKFSARPFTAAPSAMHYFAGAAIEAARQSLARCIERSEGVGLLTGPAGTGKTLLCQVLAEQVRSQMQVALLASGHLCSRRALLQAILFELGLPYRGLEEGELRLSLLDAIAPRAITAVSNPIAPSVSKTTSNSRAAQNVKSSTAAGTTTHLDGLTLIVDEAHTLPYRLLEELRLITNFARNGQSRVRLVLAGSPELEERFASPKMNSFNQRVAVRSYLEALDRKQTGEYVQQQIAAVHGNKLLFAIDALSAVYHATDGIPRLINQVCDHTLLLAFANGMREISATLVEEAWSDLQQLPTPWNAAAGAPAKAHSGSVVEFGNLDDDSALADELPAALPFHAAATDSGETKADKKAVAAKQAAGQKEYDDPRLIGFDDDFQPAGSIQPEIELMFSPGDNPFLENFDEEEVVIDRYMSLETDVFANRPVVRSTEGRQIGAALPPAQTPRDQAISAESVKRSMAIAPSTWPGGIPESDQAATESNVHWGDDANQADLSDAEPESSPRNFDADSAAEFDADADPDFDSASDVAADLESADVAAKTRPAAAAPVSPTQSPAIAAELNDDDLIIVEDVEEIILPAAKPRVPVRRREYRQLFAQLRRG